MTQLGPRLTLTDTSRSGPALVHFHDPVFDKSWLFTAWSGVGNEFINLMHVDEFAGQISKSTSSETTRKPPYLAVHDGGVVIAWTGSGNPGQLNVSPINVGIGQGDTEHPQLRLFDQTKVTLVETSTEAPALASHSGRLIISWTNVGTNRINLMISEDNGAQFHGKITLVDTAIGRPVIAAHRSRLFIAWTGSDHQLNIARVVTVLSLARPGRASHLLITGLSGKMTLAETSDAGPALASFADRLAVAWTSAGDRHLNFLFSRDDGASFHDKFTSSEQARDAPVLAAGGGRLYVSWTGVDPEGHLNLAAVDPS